MFYKEATTLSRSRTEVGKNEMIYAKKYLLKTNFYNRF